jgi:FtsH-binding integral membrane protein
MAKKTIDDAAVAGMDVNGDGHISKEEMDMHLEFKRKEMEDQDAQRDAMRKMTWFALMGMLLYPFAIVLTSFLGLPEAAEIVGDIAPTYFVAIAALVAAFFGADAIKKKP